MLSFLFCGTLWFHSCCEYSSLKTGWTWYILYFSLLMAWKIVTFSFQVDDNFISNITINIFFGSLVNYTFSNLQLNVFIITDFICSKKYVNQIVLISYSWISPTLQRRLGLEFCLFSKKCLSPRPFFLIPDHIFEQKGVSDSFQTQISPKILSVARISVSQSWLTWKSSLESNPLTQNIV